MLEACVRRDLAEKVSTRSEPLSRKSLTRSTVRSRRRGASPDPRLACAMNAVNEPS